MSQVIRLSDEIFSRLEAHAKGFDTPTCVIERLLDTVEEHNIPIKSKKLEEYSNVLHKAESLDICYLPGGKEETFRKSLLDTKRAYIKMYKTDETTEVKEWNASKFTHDSNLSANLRSGFLRGWKDKGIYKAELAVDKSYFD